MSRLFSAVLCCSFVSVAMAGQYNTTVNIGDEAPSWKDLPGTDDELHSSGGLVDRQATVVVFTCNSCPYAVDVEDRLIKLHETFASRGVAIVAINVNRIEEDLLPAMKEKAKEKRFPFVYLFDETQEIAKAFGAKYTPEFFVLDGNCKIAYMGSLDDSPEGREVSKTYVADALDAVLSGSEVETTETVPIGCRIRFERTRRTRKKK
ncbi:MAG: thioredoxin family protein [Planctomycetota bacterium]